MKSQGHKTDFKMMISEESNGSQGLLTMRTFHGRDGGGPTRKYGLDLEYLWFSHVRVHQNHLDSLLKTQISIPRASDSVSLGWGPQIYISNQFSDAAADARPGTIHFEKPYSSRCLLLKVWSTHQQHQYLLGAC